MHKDYAPCGVHMKWLTAKRMAAMQFSACWSERGICADDVARISHGRFIGQPGWNEP